MNFSEVDAYNYLKDYDRILYTMERKMLCFKKKDNITLTFIAGMIPHHQAAISMCENVLRYTKNYPLRQICRNIILIQRQEIKYMREITRISNDYNSSSLEEKNYLQRYVFITREMIRRMNNTPRGRNINWDFVSEMIFHHQGAIAMCQNVLQYRIDPRLRQLARQIIRQQQKGMEELENIRRILLGENRKG